MKNTTTPVPTAPHVVKTKIGKTEFIIHSFYNANGKVLSEVLEQLILYKAKEKTA